MSEPRPDLAMLIEATVARDADPLTRFVRSLPNDPPVRLRAFAEETVRLREELLSNVQRMLASSSPREAAGYAEWTQRNVFEVGYRWTSLLRSAQRWLELDVGALSVKAGRPEKGHDLVGGEPTLGDAWGASCPHGYSSADIPDSCPDCMRTSEHSSCNTPSTPGWEPPRCAECDGEAGEAHVCVPQPVAREDWNRLADDFNRVVRERDALRNALRPFVEAHYYEVHGYGGRALKPNSFRPEDVQEAKDAFFGVAALKGGVGD